MAKISLEFSLRFLILAIALVAVSLFWFWTRPAYVAFSQARLTTKTFTGPPFLDEHFPEPLHANYAVVTLSNTSRYAIWYDGSVSRSNCIVSQHMRTTDSWFQCGFSTVPSRWVALPPRQAVDIKCQFDDDAQALKFGVKLKGAMFGTPTLQWSEACIVPPELMEYSKSRESDNVILSK